MDTSDNSRLLSQQEIDELMSVLQAPNASSTGSAARSEVTAARTRPLDLLRQNPATRRRIPNIDIIFENFGRNLGISLTNRLQRPVNVRIGAIETVEFEQMLARASQKHHAIGVIKMDPLKTSGLAVIENPLSFALIEMQLGGSTAGSVSNLERPLTVIEQHMVQTMIDGNVLPDLVKAFATVEKLDLSLLKLETNPRLVSIVGHDQLVLVVPFSVTIESFSGTLQIIIPQAGLEPLRERLREGAFAMGSGASEDWTNALRSEIRRIPLSLRVTLPPFPMRVEELETLAPGTIIDLGSFTPHSPVILSAGGKPKFYCLMGQRGGRRSVSVLKAVPSDKES